MIKNILAKLGITSTSLLCIIPAGAQKKEKPNILWIYLEDTAPLMSCYGTTLISTPNIDYLAENGVRFTNAIMPAPVSSPCRSGIITGCMPTTFGVHNHHSSRVEESAIYLPDHVQTIPEIFKDNGYFIFNNGKDDYNFIYDRKDLYSQDYYMHPIYGKSGERLDLTTLKDKEPFFGQIQLYGGKEIFSSKFDERVENPVDRDNIHLPPYLPDHPVIIEEYADHLDAIQITDKRVGEIINKLKTEGLLENTIIFFFSDHGMRLTRNKQFLYEGGIHVPMIIASFNEQPIIESGSVRDDLISGIDLGTTSLAIAGITIPDYMEGLDIFDQEYHRDFVISSRDRCDFSIDRIRSVRSEKFKYIRNYLTDRPYMQNSYMDVDSVPFVLTMKQLYTDGKLNDVQARFMLDEKPKEELYDLHNDPHEINNLADDPKYADILKKHQNILSEWIAKTNDKGQQPENEEGVMFMYGIWGKYATNPEYDILRKKYPEMEGALFHLKSEKWKKVSD